MKKKKMLKKKKMMKMMKMMKSPSPRVCASEACEAAGECGVCRPQPVQSADNVPAQEREEDVVVGVGGVGRKNLSGEKEHEVGLDEGK